MKTHRHHLNPLLKQFCPSIYSLFRRQDIIEIDGRTHFRYHNTLRENSDYQRLFAEIEELDCDRTCDEY